MSPVNGGNSFLAADAARLQEPLDGYTRYIEGALDKFEDSVAGWQELNGDTEADRAIRKFLLESIPPAEEMVKLLRLGGEATEASLRRLAQIVTDAEEESISDAAGSFGGHRG